MKYSYYNTIRMTFPTQNCWLGSKFQLLKNRRTKASQVFLHDVLHGRVKDPYLLSIQNAYVPRLHFRIENTFWLPVARTNALKHAIVNSSTAANDERRNLELHPIDLKFYILVFDIPTTKLEPGCSRLLPPHHSCGGK